MPKCRLAVRVRAMSLPPLIDLTSDDCFMREVLRFARRDYKADEDVPIKNVQYGSFNPESDSRMNDQPGKLPPHCVLQDGDVLPGNVGRACLGYDGSFLLNQHGAKLAPIEAFDWHNPQPPPNARPATAVSAVGTGESEK